MKRARMTMAATIVAACGGGQPGPAGGSAGGTAGLTQGATTEATGLASEGSSDTSSVPPGGCPTQPLEGSFTATNDSELEQLQGVTEVTDDLTISGVTQLDALQCLRSIGGHLRISSTELTDLTGLESLSRAHDVTVANNAALTSFDGLGIVEVESVLSVFGNDALEVLRLEHLSSAAAVAIGQCLGTGGVGNAVVEIDLPALALGDGISVLGISANYWLTSLDLVLEVSASIGTLVLEHNEMLDGPATAQAWVEAGNDAINVHTCGNLNDVVRCMCPAL
jgi:hypothetical protein